MKLNTTFNVNKYGDSDIGFLSPLSRADIPYDIKRIFWITDTLKDVVRGRHAHIKCLQTYICLQGKILVESDDGYEKDSKILNRGDAVTVPPLLWTSEKFLTGKDILLVICSHEYDPDDYIFTMDKLLEYIDNNAT